MDKLCAVTEISDKNFHLTRTSVFSFIEKNKWFTGKLYLLFHPNLPVSQKSIEIITSIYQDIELINCSQKDSFNQSIGSKGFTKNTELFISSYKNSIPSLKKESIFYFSNNCLFLKSILSLIENEEFSFFSHSFYLKSCEIFPKDLDAFDETNSNAALASSFSDNLFIKNKNRLLDLSFIIFDTFTNNVQSFSKINQIWLHSNNKIQNFLNNPSNARLALTRDFTELTASTQKNINKYNQSFKDDSFSVSIIIPAFKAHNYIKDCLDSIKNQKTLASIEILVGIDNCEETLSELNKIAKDYPNIKVFFSNKSIGAYVMRNSLIEFTSHENLLFFDADDIMKEGMIAAILYKYTNHQPIRFKYFNFTHGANPIIHNSLNKGVAHGVFFINKALFDKIGGFQDWLCGADTDFMKRCLKNKILDLHILSPLFYRRIHSKSLTQDPSTGFKSTLRNEIAIKIKNTRVWPIPLSRVTSKLQKIK